MPALECFCQYQDIGTRPVHSCVRNPTASERHGEDEKEETED